ncbi:MAG: 50S ribosomal protein L13 [Myxococcota bacterium]
MRTPMSNHNMINRQWHVIDAKDAVLGRLATKAACLLRGKHKPTFVPHEDTGDFVVVINAEHVRVTGNKEADKRYWRHSGYPGSERAVTVAKLREQFPQRLVRHAIAGMLPKGTLGRQTLKKLKVYAQGHHPHQSQQPQGITLN